MTALANGALYCASRIALRQYRAFTYSAITRYAFDEDINSADLPQMSEKEMQVYKLYRPEQVVPNVRGVDLLNEAHYNKGMAFSLHERQALGIHGLLPPAFMTEEQQEYRVMSKLRAQPDDLARYVQLDSLQDRDEKLYYRVLCANIEELMTIVHTPTVGLVCKNFGSLYRKPKGLYVTINDNSISKIHHILNNWPENDVRVIVVTDGEQILGMGDLGCYGMGVPVGKLALYVALGGFQPQWCLPVQIDVGTDNEDLLKDPFYIGLRRKRVRGAEYDKLIENFMKACTKRFGYHTLVHFEDFSDKNAYQLLQRYNNKYTVFNDAVQASPTAILAGVLASARITGMKPSQQKFVIFGSDAKVAGTAEMLHKQMVLEGLSEEEARSQIYIMNAEQQLLTTGNTDKFLNHLAPFAKDCQPIHNLIQLVEEVQPAALIGGSGKQGAFTEKIIATMSKINQRPIIFALSGECMPDDAYNNSNGNALFACGVRTSRLTVDGKVRKAGMASNAYIYPGVALGVILFRIRHMDDSLFLVAAKKVAECVTENDLRMGHIYPGLRRAREISIEIAVEIAKHCYENGTATLQPQPEDLEQYIRAQLFRTSYEPLIQQTYKWPEHDMKHGFPVPVARRESVDE